MAPKPIRQPRRIFVVSLNADSGVLPFLKALTGEAPASRSLSSAESSRSATANTNSAVGDDTDNHNENEQLAEKTSHTTAGLTHALTLNNAYYTATIPIWIDEAPTPRKWADDFSTPEAHEVVCAVNAWFIVFQLPSSEAEKEQARQTLIHLGQAVQRVVEHAHDENGYNAYDGICLAVGWPSRVITSRQSEPRDVDLKEGEFEMWDDMCMNYGFEFIDGGKKGRNEMGEVQGLERVREALEANDWEAVDDEEGDVLHELGDVAGDEDADAFGDLQSGGDAEDTGFSLEKAEMDRELLGFKMSMAGGNQPGSGYDDHDFDDEDATEARHVEELERMVAKMMAVREMSSHLPEQQRRRHAVKAVNEYMRTM